MTLFLLNRLPEVKKFLFDDLEQKYENAKFKRQPGKSPTMMLYDEVRYSRVFDSLKILWMQDGNVVEKLDISEYKRDELNKLMLDKGFKLKDVKKEEESNVGHDEV